MPSRPAASAKNGGSKRPVAKAQKPKNGTNKAQPKEFVFDSAGTGQVVLKQTATKLKKQRKKSQREAALRAEAVKNGAKKTDKELRLEAKKQREEESLDRNQVWRSIRALSASQLKGWKLREWQEMQRRELGAKATSLNRKMPLKMRTGIMRKRKIVTQRQNERIRESGVVTASHKGNKKKYARTARTQGGSSASTAGDVGNGGVRDGVMNVRYLMKK